MKKLSTIILSTIGIVGAYMVGEGLITGEELTDIQSVIGLALSGGSVSLGLIIAIIGSIPKQLVSEGYNKAVEKYGQAAVDDFVSKIDVVMDFQTQNNILLTEVKGLLTDAQDQRESLLNE